MGVGGGEGCRGVLETSELGKLGKAISCPSGLLLGACPGVPLGGVDLDCWKRLSCFPLLAVIFCIFGTLKAQANASVCDYNPDGVPAEVPAFPRNRSGIFRKAPQQLLGSYGALEHARPEPLA